MPNTPTQQNSIQNHLLDTKIAILLATGFCDLDFGVFQKFFTSQGAHIKLISVEQGLVTSWNDSNWGHNYAVDLPLNQALASDFKACMIPGGKRSLEKLTLSGHSGRFVNGFLSANKTVVAMNDAVAYLNRMNIQDSDRLKNNVDQLRMKDSNVKAISENKDSLHALISENENDSLDELTRIMFASSGFDTSRQAA